ncbi:MAG: long-subunit fatty acid transport protein [Verrucomicrobiales bacterium]
MKPSRSDLLLLQISYSIVVIAIALPATAGVVNRNGVSARAAGLAGADTTSDNDALAALSRNPALLSTHAAPNVQLSATGIVASGSYRNKRNEQSSFDGTGLFPEAAVAIPFRDSRWTLGLGSTVSAAREVDWHYRDVAGGVDGATSYGSLEHSSRFLAVRTAAAFISFLQ